MTIEALSLFAWPHYSTLAHAENGMAQNQSSRAFRVLARASK